MKTKEFYRELNKCFKKSITAKDRFNKLNSLISRYKDEPICKYVNKKVYGEIYHNPPEKLKYLCDVGKNYPLVILMYMANKFVNYNDDRMYSFEIISVFMEEDEILQDCVGRPLRNETHTLFKRGIVEMKSVDEKSVKGKSDSPEKSDSAVAWQKPFVFHLTDAAKREMFEEGV